MMKHKVGYVSQIIDPPWATQDSADPAGDHSSDFALVTEVIESTPAASQTPTPPAQTSNEQLVSDIEAMPQIVTNPAPAQLDLLSQASSSAHEAARLEESSLANVEQDLFEKSSQLILRPAIDAKASAQAEIVKELKQETVLRSPSHDNSEDIGALPGTDQPAASDLPGFDSVTEACETSRASLDTAKSDLAIKSAQDVEDSEADIEQPKSWKSVPLPASIGKDIAEPSFRRENIVASDAGTGIVAESSSAGASFSFDNSIPDNFGNRQTSRPNTYNSNSSQNRNSRDGQGGRNLRDSSRDFRGSGARAPAFNSALSAKSKADMEALFSGKPDSRTALTPSGVVAENTPGATQRTAEQNAQTSTPESAPAKRTFLVSSVSDLLGLPAEKREAPGEKIDLDSLALTRKLNQVPIGVTVVAQDTVDLKSLSRRMDTLTPEQALAWLLATDVQNLKPLTHQLVKSLVQQYMAKIGDESLHQLHPAGYWVIDPFTEISLYSDHKYRRKAKEWPSNLPGNVGVWLSSAKLSSNESTKRSANAQRINEISLAGIVMACDRFEAMEVMLAERLDPLRVAARIGCAVGVENKGHTIGEISGYALSMVAHSNQFFSWCNQWQPLLRKLAMGRANEISSALSLAIKTWTAGHGELDQDCAEMAATMLQLGASVSEWGLMAFAPYGRREAGPAVAWARFCAQTFSIDRQGVAVQRIIDSANIHGFKLQPVDGDSQPMTPFAQANLAEAVSVFLRAGFDPNLTDALGQTVSERARSARADKVLVVLRAHARGESLPEVKLPLFILDEREFDESIDALENSGAYHMDYQRYLARAPEEFNPPLIELLKEKQSLEELIASMISNAMEIRELDPFIGLGEIAFHREFESTES